MWALVHHFDLHYIPVAKGRPRMTKRGIAYTPSKTKNAERSLQVLIQERLDADWTPMEGPIKIELTVFLPRPKSHTKKQRLIPYSSKRPDIDNLEKLFLDAANGLLYGDDAQIAEKFSAKRYADECSPGYVVTLSQWEDEG